MKIAILGWGSLLWDKREDFDRWHDAWEFDGPSINLEFSRISESRSDALTLVIDAEHGSPATIAYCLSRRRKPEDAICDLRCREGTSLSRVGYVFLEGNRHNYQDKESFDAIVAWSKAKKFDVVVWSNLQSNFEEKKKQPFSIDSAISHIKSLSLEGKAKTAEYVWRAPTFIRTPLRDALEQEPWFSRLEG